MKTDGLSFPEAVERLADEAGVPMPKLGPRDEAREDERERLYRIVEMSAALFRGGADDRRRRRGAPLPRKARADARDDRRFRLGYAPNDRAALRTHFANAGFKVEEMIASGMLIGGDDIPVAYDRFRHRVTFPIADLRGRVIAFGGRALDANAPAKYLNSPDTPLFHKGQILFNAHRARGPPHDKDRVVAVEGYMDVIALTEAGFGETVAPLGTALTEEQIKLLWRMADEPILCFDGDAAGRKAAFRAVETALPLLKPGFSVRFAFLPGGLDPDDLVRQQGPQAFADELGKTRALFDVLWEREAQEQDLSTPEQRAAFEARLKAHGGQDRRCRRALPLRERAARDAVGAQSHAWYARSPAARAPARAPAAPSDAITLRPTGASASAHASAPRPRPLPQRRQNASPELAARTEHAPAREALLIKTLLNHPWLLDEHAEEIAALTLASAPLARLRDAMLGHQAVDNNLDSARLRSQLSVTGLGKVVDLVERSVTHRSDRFAEPDAPRAEVEVGWRHALALHERQVGLQKSLEAAVQAYHRDGSEDALARICEIQGLLARASEQPVSAD